MLLRIAEGSEGHGRDDDGPEQGLSQNLEAKGKRKESKKRRGSSRPRAVQRAGILACRIHLWAC